MHKTHKMKCISKFQFDTVCIPTHATHSVPYCLTHIFKYLTNIQYEYEKWSRLLLFFSFISSFFSFCSNKRGREKNANEQMEWNRMPFVAKKSKREARENEIVCFCEWHIIHVDYF